MATVVKRAGHASDDVADKLAPGETTRRGVTDPPKPDDMAVKAHPRRATRRSSPATG